MVHHSSLEIVCNIMKSMITGLLFLSLVVFSVSLPTKRVSQRIRRNTFEDWHFKEGLLCSQKNGTEYIDVYREVGDVEQDEKTQLVVKYAFLSTEGDLITAKVVVNEKGFVEPGSFEGSVYGSGTVDNLSGYYRNVFVPFNLENTQVKLMQVEKYTGDYVQIKGENKTLASGEVELTFEIESINTIADGTQVLFLWRLNRKGFLEVILNGDYEIFRLGVGKENGDQVRVIILRYSLNEGEEARETEVQLQFTTPDGTPVTGHWLADANHLLKADVSNYINGSIFYSVEDGNGGSFQIAGRQVIGEDSDRVTSTFEVVNTFILSNGSSFTYSVYADDSWKFAGDNLRKHYSYEDDNGTSVNLTVQHSTLLSGDVGKFSTLEYSYIAPDGDIVSTQWYGDETGLFYWTELLTGEDDGSEGISLSSQKNGTEYIDIYREVGDVEQDEKKQLVVKYAFLSAEGDLITAKVVVNEKGFLEPGSFEGSVYGSGSVENLTGYYRKVFVPFNLENTQVKLMQLETDTGDYVQIKGENKTLASGEVELTFEIESFNTIADGNRVFFLWRLNRIGFLELINTGDYEIFRLGVDKENGDQVRVRILRYSLIEGEETRETEVQLQFTTPDGTPVTGHWLADANHLLKADVGNYINGTFFYSVEDGNGGSFQIAGRQVTGEDSDRVTSTFEVVNTFILSNGSSFTYSVYADDSWKFAGDNRPKHYSYEDDNGTSVNLTVQHSTLLSGKVGKVLTLEYSYIAPDGDTVSTQWYGDETGLFYWTELLTGEDDGSEGISLSFENGLGSSVEIVYEPKTLDTGATLRTLTIEFTDHGEDVSSTTVWYVDDTGYIDGYVRIREESCT